MLCNSFFQLPNTHCDLIVSCPLPSVFPPPYVQKLIRRFDPFILKALFLVFAVFSPLCLGLPEGVLSGARTAEKGTAGASTGESSTYLIFTCLRSWSFFQPYRDSLGSLNVLSGWMDLSIKK